MLEKSSPFRKPHQRTSGLRCVTPGEPDPLAYKLLALRWTTGVVGESALAENGATGASCGGRVPVTRGTESRTAVDTAGDVGDGAGRSVTLRDEERAEGGKLDCEER